jgi:hypothetical protein
MDACSQTGGKTHAPRGRPSRLNNVPGKWKPADVESDSASERFAPGLAPGGRQDETDGDRVAGRHLH